MCWWNSELELSAAAEIVSQLTDTTCGVRSKIWEWLYKKKKYISAEVDVVMDPNAE